MDCIGRGNARSKRNVEDAMTIDLIAGWWVIMDGEEVIAQLDSESVTQDQAYRVLDFLEEGDEL